MQVRTAVQAGLSALVVALAAGAMIGSGLAETVLDTADQLTWLRNNRGQVTRVNPETGTLVDRLQVGGVGDELHVVQGNGVLIVTNLRTHEVTFVDLPLLRVGGVRQGPAGVKVLLADRQIYLVNRQAGQIELVDPLTAATVGQPWRSGTPLVDAAVDATGAVWALDDHGGLAALQWSPVAGAFAVQDRRDLPDTSAETVLMGHELGVTAFDPGGAVTQVGPGRTRTLRTSGLAAPLLGADVSPADLAPVTSGTTSQLRLVRGDSVIEVDGAAFGCPQLGRAAVYRNLVHIPCPGARKVIVLDRAGRRAGQDLVTPAGGEPELILNAGLLIVNVVGATTGLVVKPDGSTVEIRTDDPRVPVLNPSNRPTALPSGLGIRTPRPPATSQRGPTTGGRISAPPGTTASPTGRAAGSPTAPTAPPNSTRPSTVPPATSTPPSPTPRPGDLAPSGVTATARPDGTIHVSWTPPLVPPASYRVLRSDTGQQVATAPAGGTVSIISGLPLGQPVSFIVVAVTPGGTTYPSAPSNPVSAYGRPGGPAVGVVLSALSPTRITLQVTVDVLSDGGRPVTGYDLEVTSDAGRTLLNVRGVPIGQRPYQFTADCAGPTDLCLRGGSVTATATLDNSAGAGPPAATTAGIPGPPPFAYGQYFMYVSSGGKCLDVDLRLHACSGSAGQFWRHLSTGDIRNQLNNMCLAYNDDLHFADSGCTDREKRWRRVNEVGNEAQVRGQYGDQECLYVTGDPAGEGVRVLDGRQCFNGTQDRWTAWRQAGVPITAAAASTPELSPAGSAAAAGASGPIAGAETIVLLLIPLAAGVARMGRRRRTTVAA